MATMIRTERGVFGLAAKWAFILFNILMLVWMVSGFHAVSGIEANSDAERVGHAIGSIIGFASLLTLWVSGDVILGIMVLLTRGKMTIVEDGSDLRLSSRHSTFGNADALIDKFKAEGDRIRQAGTSLSASPGARVDGSKPVFGKRR